MTMSVAVDFALSLLLWFLLVSLAVSAVNESISRALALRSRHLWRTLSRLLDEDEPSPAKSARPARSSVPAQTLHLSATHVYKHPLVNTLEGGAFGKKARLSHIPAENFARAIVDILKPDGTADATVEGFKSKVGDLPDANPAKAPLLAIASQAGGAVTDLRAAIGSWFDSGMQALSVQYRLHVKVMMFIIALVMAWIINADSLRAAEVFYRDDAVRTAASAQAVKVVDKCAAEEDSESCLDNGAEAFRQAIDLPIGWDGARSFEWWRSLGWLITAIAASQGAPFWFDLLSRARRWKSTEPVSAP